jgi:hypothetical protein
MKTIVVLLLVVVLFASFIYWRKGETEEREEAGDLFVNWDTSSSTQSLGCDAMARKVRERLFDPSFRTGRKSRYFLIVTGGFSSSLEPRLVIDLPLPRRTGLGVGGKRKIEEFVKTIATECSKFPRAEGSAIFRSLQITLQHMKARNCDRRECELLLGSDGLENADRAVAQFLISRDPKSTPPATLDNSVARRSTWCGYVQASEGGGPRRNMQAIMDRWSVLFTRPVAMEPYCSAEEDTPESQARR